MELVIQIAQIAAGIIAALGLREAWPYLYKYIKGRQSIPAAAAKAAKQERQEYSEGWREVSDRLREDLNTEKEERKVDRDEHRKETRALQEQVAKCERRDRRRSMLLSRSVDRIRELGAILKGVPGVTVRPWTLEEAEVDAALDPNGETHDGDSGATPTE